MIFKLACVACCFLQAAATTCSACKHGNQAPSLLQVKTSQDGTSNSFSHDCALPQDAQWCTVSLGLSHGDFDMAVYKTSDIVSQSICSSGTWELSHSDVTALGKPGHAMDIGANIGFYSLVLAAAGWNVTAFEPMPNNWGLIDASLCQNPGLKSKVTLHKVGLGAKDDHCNVISEISNVGDGLTRCGADADEAPAPRYKKRADITVRRLDDVLKEQGVDRINFVKMDVEGFECQVMVGAQTLLSQFRPKFIQSEVWPKMQGCTPSQYLSSFANANYTVSMDKECLTQDPSALDSPTGIVNRYMCRESEPGANLLSLLDSNSRRHRSIVWFQAA